MKKVHEYPSTLSMFESTREAFEPWVRREIQRIPAEHREGPSGSGMQERPGNGGGELAFRPSLNYNIGDEAHPKGNKLRDTLAASEPCCR